MLYIVVGVFFEEIIFRQLLFLSLHGTLRLAGDTLVVVAALFFAMGHSYQGVKGVFWSLIIGIMLGKIFLLKESLAYPIVLHLCLNLTLAVMAFRRIRAINNLSDTSHL